LATLLDGYFDLDERFQTTGDVYSDWDIDQPACRRQHAPTVELITERWDIAFGGKAGACPRRLWAAPSDDSR
jgi:hypothetical protein